MEIQLLFDPGARTSAGDSASLTQKTEISHCQTSSVTAHKTAQNFTFHVTHEQPRNEECPMLQTRHHQRDELDDGTEEVFQIKDVPRSTATQTLLYQNRTDPLTSITRFVSAIGYEFGCIKPEADNEDGNVLEMAHYYGMELQKSNSEFPTSQLQKSSNAYAEGASASGISYRNDPGTSLTRFASAVGYELGCIKSEVDDEEKSSCANKDRLNSKESHTALQETRLEAFVSYLPRWLQFIAYDCFGVRQIGGGGELSDSDEELTKEQLNYGILQELKTSERDLAARMENIKCYIGHLQGKRKKGGTSKGQPPMKKRKLLDSEDQFDYNSEEAFNDNEPIPTLSNSPDMDIKKANIENSQSNSSLSSDDIESPPSNAQGEEKVFANTSLKVGQTFKDFEAFEHALGEFKVQSFTHLRKYNMNRNQCKDDDLKKFPFRCVTYICSHGGQIKSRSKNIRPGQSYLSTNCPMKLYVQLRKDFTTFEKVYEITNFIPEHEGHEVSKEAYSLHIQGRRPSHEEKETILKYVNMNVPAREIRKEMFKETGKNLSSQDIGNVQRLAQKNAGGADNDIKETLEFLKKQHEADIGSTLRIVYSEEKESCGKSIIKIVYWQSASSKAALRKYGQVMHIDGTYTLTCLDYVLYPILVVDSHRRTRLIAWALLCNEKREVLNEFLQIFVEANPSSPEVIKFISLDKNLHQIAALGTVLPAARFLLCRVHVLKTVKEHIGKIKLPPKKQYLKQQLDRLFQKMVHSPYENSYQEAWEGILNLANENPELEKFTKYLEDNWHYCRDHFAECRIGKLHHFNTKTNNRSENFNMLLKQRIRKQSRIPVVVKALLDIEADQDRRAVMRDYESLCKQYKPVNLDDNPNVAELLRSGRKVVMKEALKLMQMQCELSSKVREDDLNKDVDQLKCTKLHGECEFYCNYRLPCKHLFATRNLNTEDVFDVKMIPRHWLIDKSLADHVVEEPRDDVVLTKSKSSSSLASGYNASKAQLQELQETLSKCPKADQEIYIKMIKMMNEALKKNRTVTFDEGQLFVETNEDDFECSQEPSETIEETLEFSSARKSQKKVQGHTVRKGQKSGHKSGLDKRKDQDSDSEEADAGEQLPPWMKTINQKMKKLGAINLWTQHEFNILANSSTSEGEGLWLSDSHLHYFTILFNHQFKNIQKMQETILADCSSGLKKINEKEIFIQAIHIDRHWALLTNIGVPQAERESTVVGYDSLVHMVSKDQCLIRDKMIWQAAQLLRPETKGCRKGMAMLIKPCHQQPNGNDCGLYAVANCVSLAYGHDPSNIYYSGNLRQEFLQMIRNAEIRMFSYQPRSAFNEHNFFTDIPTSKFSSINSQVPEIKHSFDIVCHCSMPLSYGNTVDCETCKETYHIQCYLVNNGSKIIDHLNEFRCYKCRRPGNYDFLQTSMREKGDKQQIIQSMAKSISSLDNSRLRKYLPHIESHKKDRNYFFSLKSYLKFEALLEKYDLNSVAAGVGHIYHAMDEYYHRSSREIKGALLWSKLSEAQVVHLAVLLICDASKTNLPPLITIDRDDELDTLSGENFLKKNKSWIGVLEKAMIRAKAKTKKLFEKNTKYAKAMPEISSLRSELKEMREHVHTILEGLGKEGSAQSQSTQSVYESGQMALLKKILTDSNECNEELDQIQKR